AGYGSHKRSCVPRSFPIDSSRAPEAARFARTDPPVQPRALPIARIPLPCHVRASSLPAAPPRSRQPRPVLRIPDHKAHGDSGRFP
ncbi:unnamed protein product, partial [Mycena citricolor]